MKTDGNSLEITNNYIDNEALEQLIIQCYNSQMSTKLKKNKSQIVKKKKGKNYKSILKRLKLKTGT